MASVDARAGTVEAQLFMSEPEHVQKACNARDSNDGIICREVSNEEFDAAQNGNERRYNPVNCNGHEFPASKRELTNIIIKRKYCGEILITKKSFSTSTYFYEGIAVAVRTSNLGNSRSTSVVVPDDGHVTSALEALGNAAPMTSEAAEKYVSYVSRQRQDFDVAKAAEKQRARDKADEEAAFARSPAGIQQEAIAEIQNCKWTIAYAKRGLAREARAAQISGVTNLSVREQAGRMIASCEDQIAMQWGKYKAAGGGLSSVRSIETPDRIQTKVGYAPDGTNG